jgi:hypothetical protein
MRALVLAAGVALVGCGGRILGDDGGASGADASLVDGPSVYEGVELPAACPALQECGGDPRGTWDYTGACIDDAVDKLKGSCPTADVQNPTGTADGWVQLDGQTVLRTISVSITATVVFPAECTGGAECSAVQASLPPGSTCTGSGACSCTITNTYSISDSDTYSLDGNVVVTGGGARYAFCIQGDVLDYTDRGEHPEFHGTFSMKKR